MLHGESSKRLAPPTNKVRKHLQSTQTSVNRHNSQTKHRALSVLLGSAHTDLEHILTIIMHNHVGFGLWAQHDHSIAHGSLKQQRLYRLDCKMMNANAEHEGYANVSSEAMSTRTWHARLGHPGRQALMAVVAEAKLDDVVPQELDRVWGICQDRTK